MEFNLHAFITQALDEVNVKFHDSAAFSQLSPQHSLDSGGWGDQSRSDRGGK
jgi:hypothetical protein